jgi:simple sugar transport system ATP-binding protein
VEGNGQRELLRAVAGLLPFEGALALGPGASVGFIPEDRQTEGLILDFSVRDNLALDAALGFWINKGFMENQAAVAVDEFAIRILDAEQPVRTLSGGNQQKIVLARVLAQSHSLLVAENPTRGLDIRSTADVHERLRQAARQKRMGVLLHSGDLDEVLELSDRIAVMAGGAWYWVDDANRSRERIGAMMLGTLAA